MTTNPTASGYALRLAATAIGSQEWRAIREEILTAGLLTEVRAALGKLAAHALGHPNKLKARG